jgi:hypothetical protein
LAKASKARVDEAGKLFGYQVHRAGPQIILSPKHGRIPLTVIEGDLDGNVFYELGHRLFDTNLA